MPIRQLLIAFCALYCLAAQAADSVTMAECLSLAGQSADDKTTIGELRTHCKRQLQEAQTSQTMASETAIGPGIVVERSSLERYAEDNPFVLTPHRTNYVLPVSYRDHISDFGDNLAGKSEEIDHFEVEFQLSIKVKAWDHIFREGNHLSIAYTNRSFWQAYNDDASKPFRETNHEPEVILNIASDWKIGQLSNVANQLIINHQSNGRSDPESRSWNRIMLNMVFERGRWAMSFKPWYRIPEAPNDDDNRDIEHYMGNFEWMSIYSWRQRTLSILLRNNLRSDNKGAVELGWSFPINKRVKAYVKYFNGYGESLIEYNNAVESIGIGVLISDWL